jgi:adenylate kinase family enzyme
MHANMEKTIVNAAPIKRDVKDVVRDFFNVGKVKRLFRMGAEIFSAAAPFVEKQTPLNAAKAAFTIGKIIVDDLEVWPDDFFDDHWVELYPLDFTKTVLRALVNKPYKVIRTSDESIVIHRVFVEDVTFGYILNTRTGYVDRVYVEDDRVDNAKAIVKKELWRVMKGENIVLRQPARPGRQDGETVTLEVDDAFQPMSSKRASEYSSYLKKCIDSGVSRSVLLYGPPGTGKSTMARTIVDNLGMKSFRIRVEDIGHIESSSVFESINILEPDAVILDDFDRTSSQASLLETLEFFQRHVKLVIATVNDKSRLDEAILRPGRFDELVQIKKMDDDVVKAVLGEDHADAYETVKEWPIAFIQEYVKRRRFMTPEEATESTAELAKRVKRLSRFDDDDEYDSQEASIPSADQNEYVIANTFNELLEKTKKKTRRRKLPKV